jgi:outer membrane protein assembly factor BamE (lipoprotein component of BamABCDE complex)
MFFVTFCTIALIGTAFYAVVSIVDYCARRALPKVVRQVRVGMSRAEVLEKLGRPDDQSDDEHDAVWTYRYECGEMDVGFLDSDCCMYLIYQPIGRRSYVVDSDPGMLIDLFHD